MSRDEGQQGPTRVVDAQFENSGTTQLIEALRALSAGELPKPSQPPRRTNRLYVGASITTIALVTALLWGWLSAKSGASHGTLRLEADHPNVELEVDGRSVGRAPLELQLAPGVHVIEASSATARVRETVRVEEGVRRVLELDLPDEVNAGPSLDSDALEHAPESGE